MSLEPGRARGAISAASDHPGVPRAEWPSIASRDDPRVMGRWNVRCRVISLVDGLGFWALRDLHGEYMRWVGESRDLFPDG